MALRRWAHYLLDEAPGGGGYGYVDAHRWARVRSAHHSHLMLARVVDVARVADALRRVDVARVVDALRRVDVARVADALRRVDVARVADALRRVDVARGWLAVRRSGCAHVGRRGHGRLGYGGLD